MFQNISTHPHTLPKIYLLIPSPPYSSPHPPAYTHTLSWLNGLPQHTAHVGRKRGGSHLQLPLTPHLWARTFPRALRVERRVRSGGTGSLGTTRLYARGAWTCPL